MKIIFIVTFLISTVYSQNDISDVGEPNISGGRFVGPDEMNKFKFMASVQFMKVFDLKKNKFSRLGHYCGASIVNERFAVTAATCLDEDLILKESGIVVVEKFLNVGISQRRPMQQRIIEHVIFHPQYTKGRSGTSVPANICLVMVAYTFDFHKYVAPISLFNGNVNILTGCTSAGWGFDDQKKFIPNNLKMVKYRYVFDSYNELYPIPTREDEGICPGDIGGPLICNGVLVGVAAVGNACNENRSFTSDIPNDFASYYDRFTSVPFYYPWLSEYITDEDEPTTTAATSRTTSMLEPTTTTTARAL